MCRGEGEGQGGEEGRGELEWWKEKGEEGDVPRKGGEKGGHENEQ